MWGTVYSGISGVSLLLLRVPCGEGYIVVWRIRSWSSGASGLPIEGLEKEEDGPKWRLVFGDQILELCAIVIQTLLKGAQTPS